MSCCDKTKKFHDAIGLAAVKASETKQTYVIMCNGMDYEIKHISALGSGIPDAIIEYSKNNILVTDNSGRLIKKISRKKEVVNVIKSRGKKNTKSESTDNDNIISENKPIDIQ